MSLLSAILGVNDEATKGEIRQLSQRTPLSKFLPYVSYDPETKLYHNTDETVGFLFECMPLCFAGSKTMDDFMGLFRLGLPKGSVLQFILHADKDIKFILDDFHVQNVFFKHVPACNRFIHRNCHLHADFGFWHGFALILNLVNIA